MMMKRFFNENFDCIFKFVMTHIVMSVMGIMVGLAVLSIDNDAIAIIGSVVTIGFMCFMHYDDMYFVGVKEGIRIRSEGGVIDSWKGLKITLLAYSPVLLVGLAAIILDLVASDNVSGIALLIYYAVQGSFLGLYKIRVYLGVIGYVVITLIPAIFVSSLGYYMGLKDKTLRGMMGMKVKPPYDGPLERKPRNRDKM